MKLSIKSDRLEGFALMLGLCVFVGMTAFVYGNIADYQVNPGVITEALKSFFHELL